jgi:hypothetical protein
MAGLRSSNRVTTTTFWQKYYRTLQAFDKSFYSLAGVSIARNFGIVIQKLQILMKKSYQFINLMFGTTK